MNVKNVLDQLLQSGATLTPGNAPGNGTGGARGGLADMLSGRGGAALAGGALGLLLGSKRGRKLGGKVLTYGGLATLGVVAYKAYENWQRQQPGTAAVAPRTIDRLPPAEAEQHGHAILKALIAAAKSDGHIDDRERALIDAEFAKLTADTQLLNWVDAELKKPLDPVDIARAAVTPEMAAEMYLASLLVVDDENFMERSYLDELARQLHLDPTLVAELRAGIRR